MTLKRILFRIWLVVSLLWLAFWGNVIALDPNALVTLSQPKVYAAIVAPPLMVGAVCGLIALSVSVVRHWHARVRRRLLCRPAAAGRDEPRPPEPQ